MSRGTEVTLRLTLARPTPGRGYSLCDKKNQRISPQVAGDGPLSFDIPARIADDGRWLGEFVRAEGKERRFVYINVHPFPPEGGGRMKIDIHTMSEALKAQARAGKVLEAVLPGQGYATIRPIEPWRAI